jgi:hypothetical protein
VKTDKKYDFLRGVVRQGLRRTQRQMLEKSSELWLDGEDGRRAEQDGREAAARPRLNETSFTTYRDIFYSSFGGA